MEAPKIMAMSRDELEQWKRTHEVNIRCGEMLLSAIRRRKFSRGGLRSGRGVVARCGGGIGVELPLHSMAGFLTDIEIRREHGYFDVDEIPRKRHVIRKKVAWHKERLAEIEAELSPANHAQRVQAELLAEREARGRHSHSRRPQTHHRQPAQPET